MTGVVKSVLDYFYNLTGNYGIAIILLTIAVRLILLPPSINQMRFTRVSKELNPKIEELKKKYKGNQEKMNQELVELYKKYNVNPLAGCLPILVQLPILYFVIRTLMLPDLFAESPMFFNINLAYPKPGESIFSLGPQYLILPILTVVTTFINMKQTMAGTEQQANMKTMTYFMVAFLGYISLRYPAGVALYWVVGTLFAIAQYYIFEKTYKPVTVTDGEAVINEKQRSKDS